MPVLGITTLYDPRKEPRQPREGHVRAAFDLVAVHGLNGDALATWTHGKTDKLWLKDMLPDMLPDTRIMTYGYNASFVNFTSEQDLYTISAKLLSELADVRKSDEERARPVVFVCHSLGGIVVKKALLIHCTDERQTLVQQATQSVIFMGTPHSGSSLASYGKSISNILRVCTPLNPATLLLHNLKQGSRTLFELSRDFAARTKTLTIVTFFEMDKTDFILRRKTVVDMQSAILRHSNEVAIGQNANHSNITKFADDADANYRPVLTQLLDIGKNVTKFLVSAAKEVCLIPEESKDAETERLLASQLPIPKDFTFRGRGLLLNNLDQFFTGPPRPSPMPLVYVITGLGGAGKTQAAVQYALRNPTRYDAVFFIGASSHAAINASIDRYLSLLKAPNRKAVSSENKVKDFHKWLQQNKRWLLILDGADDLKILNIRSLLPKTSSGHIIVTSRDHAAIGHVSDYGDRVESLEPDAAIQALLDKARIYPPSKHAVHHASRITEMLGYLPLAIDQAGAYITARQKTLAEYEALLSKRSKDLLRETPRMARSEQTIQTAWQVNFEQLEQTSPDAISLLLLFAFLEPSEIVESMLRRGCAGKKIWGDEGQVRIVSSREVGLDPNLVDLVTDDFRFDRAIDDLLSYSLVRRIRTLENHSAIALHPLVQLYAAQRASSISEQHWQTQAILIICQAFPFNDYLEPGCFGEWGRRMFAHVPKILRVYDEAQAQLQPNPLLRHALTIMMLSASKFNTSDYKREMLDRTKSLLANDDDLHLRAWQAARESTLLRIRGDNERSYDLLQEHINTMSATSSGDESPISPLANGQRGELVLSYASNLLLDGKTSQATKELEAWKPLNPDEPSRMEKDIVRQKHVILGRALRNEGQFSHSLTHFEELLKDAYNDSDFVSSPWQAQTFSHVSDLYCEIGKPQRTLNLLQRELDHAHSNNWEKTPRAAALQMCQVEALIRQGKLQQASVRLYELDEAFNEIADPDMLTTTRHFRVHAGLARVSHMLGRWTAAQIQWQKAYAFLEKHGWTVNTKISGRSFNEAVTLFSLAQVTWRLEQYDDAQDLYAKAQDCLAKDGRKYWIVALGSYWFDYVSVPLGETGPDPVVKESVSYLSELGRASPANA